MEFRITRLETDSSFADPRSSDMQRDLNLKVKFRESRPFAPSILAEHVNKWFELKALVPTCFCCRHSKTAPPRHDSRGEVLVRNRQAKCAALFCARHYTCGLPIDSNRSRRNKPVISCATESICGNYWRSNACKYSFNVRGEPIVCTAEDAFRCFMGTNLDMLLLATTSFTRRPRPFSCAGHKHMFELD